MNEKEFKNFKTQILKSKDNSKKGDVDIDIKNLIDAINCQPSYVTLSSCSGRIIVISQDEAQQKKDCTWVYISHEEIIDEDECLKAIEFAEGNLVFKFEPFILHIGCRSLGDANSLLTCALSCGYKNSGLVIGRYGKITLAVRSPMNLEVPISHEGCLLIHKEYLKFLIQQGNDKMRKNIKQIKVFEESLSKLFNG